MAGDGRGPEAPATLSPVAADLTAQDFVERFERLDYSTWQYKDDPSEAVHLGPMAQDFRAAFGLGRYDPDRLDGSEYIEVVDHLGVHGVVLKQLLHTVQILTQRVDELEAQVACTPHSAHRD